MTDIEVTFDDGLPARRTRSVAFSQLSIEVGHLYMEDIEAGEARVSEVFRHAAPKVDGAVADLAGALGTPNPRVSTCFLLDDYFTTYETPAVVMPMLLRCAKAAGVRIDYVVRESACAVAGDLPLAEMALAMLVADPPPGTDGSRKPPQDSGWVANGVPTPKASAEAMARKVDWQPPSENSAHRHSVFIDVQLWREVPSGPAEPTKEWSCAMLAAVWQLLRLGMLRDTGRVNALTPAAEPAAPESWGRLPAVLKVNPTAAPLAAYRTFSVLPTRYVQTEAAVRTILGQAVVDADVMDEVCAMAHREGIDLGRDLLDRIEYAFTGPSWKSPVGVGAVARQAQRAG